MANSALDLCDVDAFYGDSHALQKVSFTLGEGRLLGLLGRNGAGKSTCMNVSIGLLPPRNGRVELFGSPVTLMPPEMISARGVALVPQGREIFPRLTVLENLQTGMAPLPPGQREIPDEIFTLFPVLKTMLGRRGGDLSGGQQQQLAIGRALVTRPRLLILDEPTEGIQPSIIDLIGDTLLKIKAETGISILLVEQYLDFAQELADIFYIMDRGAIVAHGPIAHLTGDVVKQHLMV